MKHKANKNKPRLKRMTIQRLDWLRAGHGVPPPDITQSDVNATVYMCVTCPCVTVQTCMTCNNCPQV